MEDYNDMEAQLSEAFIRAVGTLTRSMLVCDGTITQVNTDFTCTVQVGTGTDIANYRGVIMRTLIGQQASVIEIPKVGSKCTIVFRDGNSGRPQLLMVDQTDKLLINCSQVEFNGGKLGGMINVVDMVDVVNDIKKDNNTLKQAFAAWVVAPEDGGAALKAITADWAASELSPTVRTDIEDTTITH